MQQAATDDTKDVNESRNARVSKKILVLENLISRRARNSRTHKAKFHDTGATTTSDGLSALSLFSLLKRAVIVS